MGSLQRELFKRRKQLLEEKKKCEKALDYLPDGLVRAVKHGRKYQYYLRKSPSDKNGVYVRQKDLHKAYGIIQRDYSENYHKAIVRELKDIDNLLRSYRKCEEVINSFPEGKRDIISVYTETKEEFLNKWINTEFEHLGFGPEDPELYSSSGIRMRSKSEMLIANMLERLGIPYIYEMPLQLKNGVVVHPDFTIIDVENRRIIILEHLGMLDDMEYIQKNIRKIREYEKNGYILGDTLLLSYETYRLPVNIGIVEENLRAIMHIS